MNTNKSIKSIYLKPTIEVVLLDNEISLALESSPPVGPGETINNAPEYLKSSPFEKNLV
jgi:hypothetical protein